MGKREGGGSPEEGERRGERGRKWRREGKRKPFGREGKTVPWRKREGDCVTG